MKIVVQSVIVLFMLTSILSFLGEKVNSNKLYHLAGFVTSVICALAIQVLWR